MRDLVVFGSGGLGKEVAWLVEDLNARGENGSRQWNLLGFCDDDESKAGKDFYGYEILGTIEQAQAKFAGKEIWYLCGIANNQVRRSLAARADALGWSAATLVHPTAIISKHARLGRGTYVGILAIVSVNATVGDHVIINFKVNIGHDATVGDFTNVAPSAQVNGACVLGQEVTIGSNASIYQGKKIGDGSMVGANAFVVGNVKAGVTVIGNPARTLPTV